MSQAVQQTMSCAACGRKYPWSVGVAGKKIKCKCGELFVAPKSLGGGVAPAAAPSPRIDAAVAKLATPALQKPPSVQPVGQSSQPVMPTRAMAPATPTTRQPAAEPIDLTDDDEDDISYDLADDCDAPPPLARLPGVPVAAATLPAGKGSPKAGKAPSGIPPFAGFRPKKAGDSEEKKAEIKKLVFIGVGVLVLIGIIIGLSSLMSGATKSDDYANLPGEDGRYMRLTADDRPIEVKEWLNASKSRGVFGLEWTREKTEKMVDRYYSEGVKKVVVFGEAIMTATLCVELPDEPAKRKAFIDYAENWRVDRHQTSKDRVKDVGQKYVFLDFQIID